MESEKHTCAVGTVDSCWSLSRIKFICCPTYFTRNKNSNCEETNEQALVPLLVPDSPAIPNIYHGLSLILPGIPDFHHSLPWPPTKFGMDQLIN